MIKKAKFRFNTFFYWFFLPAPMTSFISRLRVGNRNKPVTLGVVNNPPLKKQNTYQ
jgi:hypothetical protein